MHDRARPLRGFLGCLAPDPSGTTCWYTSRRLCCKCNPFSEAGPRIIASAFQQEVLVPRFLLILVNPKTWHGLVATAFCMRSWRQIPACSYMQQLEEGCKALSNMTERKKNNGTPAMKMIADSSTVSKPNIQNYRNCSGIASTAHRTTLLLPLRQAPSPRRLSPSCLDIPSKNCLTKAGGLWFFVEG